MTFKRSMHCAAALLPMALFSVGSLVGQQCSTTAVAGDYVMACDGYVARNSTSPLIPTKLLGLVTATSDGSFSGSGTASIGGTIVTSTLSGTGTINGNCSGSAVISQTIGGQPGPNLAVGLGVTDSGNTIDAIVAVPNFVLSCSLKRTGVAQITSARSGSDGRTGKNSETTLASVYLPAPGSAIRERR